MTLSLNPLVSNRGYNGSVKKFKNVKFIRQKLVINKNFETCAAVSNFNLDNLNCINKNIAATLVDVQHSIVKSIDKLKYCMENGIADVQYCIVNSMADPISLTGLV